MSRYIDAQLLEPEAKMLYSTNSFKPLKAYTQEQIDSAPTADVAEVVHGQRVAGMREEIFCDWVCSECEALMCDDDNYCPHCGAKMDGGK